MTSQLQRRFSNNITTLCRRHLIGVFFTTFLQHRDMVGRYRNVKTITLQSRQDVVCLLGSQVFCKRVARKNFEKFTRRYSSIPEALPNVLLCEFATQFFRPTCFLLNFLKSDYPALHKHLTYMRLHIQANRIQMGML